MCRAYRSDVPAEGDADHFVRAQGRIIDLRIHRNADLARQECLTRLLGQCRPMAIQSAGDDAEAFIDEVERELRSPVVLTSTGPAASDKSVRLPHVLA
jgi:hypothetical protein